MTNSEIIDVFHKKDQIKLDLDELYEAESILVAQLTSLRTKIEKRQDQLSLAESVNMIIDGIPVSMWQPHAGEVSYHRFDTRECVRIWKTVGDGYGWSFKSSRTLDDRFMGFLDDYSSAYEIAIKKLINSGSPVKISIRMYLIDAGIDVVDGRSYQPDTNISDSDESLYVRFNGDSISIVISGTTVRIVNDLSNQRPISVDISHPDSLKSIVEAIKVVGDLRV